MTVGRIAVLAAFLAASACGKPADPTRTAATEGGSIAPASRATGAEPQAQSPIGQVASRAAPLAERFDCLRKQHAMVIAAHRGGPTRGYPANAIETFDRTLKAATRIMEVDVTQSSDGVLFLMHDEELDQQTNLSGKVAATPWSKIEMAKLRTNTGETPYHPPSLDAALDWAVHHDAVLELDKKPGTPFEAVIKAVEAHKAQDNVVLITYTDAQALDVHKRNPGLMIAVSISSLGQLQGLIRRGLAADHVIAWTGTGKPDPELWKQLAGEGVESSFGTTGRKGERYDDRFWEDGRGDEYEGLADSGLALVSTDLSDKVARALKADDRAHTACGF
jgi:glycerophosphoryl diester phosphodiesterase